MVQESKEHFKTFLAQKRTTWHSAFNEYFNKHILADVESIAKFPVVKDHFNDITGNGNYD